MDYARLEGVAMAGKSSAGATGPDLPPGRKALAEAIAALYEHLAVRTLVEASELLALEGWRKDPSEISRYRSGRRKPPIGFVIALHKLAADQAAPASVAFSPTELHTLHAAAEATFCQNCGPALRENQRLRGENSRLLARQPSMDSPPSTSAEGSNPAALSRPAPLPVPRRAGDRQRKARDVAAAQQLATSTASLRRNGQIGHAVALIQDTSASLSPLESAAAIALLRGGQDDLADTAIGINGRSRVERDVMRIAVELHALGLPDDAGAILRAALAHAPAQT
ncbi:hypothetical protein [Streptomyces sp. NPDC088915]|uniref:hypothetical protein n=1 Tax=Streptomyces sp. NPDC088915 TaxID=3365912 RepID=UPI0037FA83D7